MTDKRETATFAAGCFWGVEARFRDMNGVIDAQVGYIGGHKKDPTYKEVCTDTTGHAEAVEVIYNPDKISFEDLLEGFFNLHDPTQLNRQGPDFGSQYRSAIFYHNEEQKKAAEKMIGDLSKIQAFKNPIVTQIVPTSVFYRAEEYHQRYLEKTGRLGSCH